MSEEKKLLITISYGNIKAELSGSPQDVLISVNNFISKQIPTLDLAEKISINYSIKELIDMFGNYIKITAEGPRVWISDRKLSDKVIICLLLIVAKISFETGKTNSNSLTLQEINSSTNLNPKSISSRLSEFSKANYVEREQTDQGVRYKVTTLGINWLNGILEKKIGNRDLS